MKWNAMPPKQSQEIDSLIAWMNSIAAFLRRSTQYKSYAEDIAQEMFLGEWKRLRSGGVPRSYPRRIRGMYKQEVLRKAKEMSGIPRDPTKNGNRHSEKNRSDVPKNLTNLIRTSRIARLGSHNSLMKNQSIP
jgi:hypothetical protein